MYVCIYDVNKGRQRNVEIKKFDDLFLNRAWHCNTHKRWDENSRHAKKKTKCTVDFMISNRKKFSFRK